jgi:hypothetical protein
MTIAFNKRRPITTDHYSTVILMTPRKTRQTDAAKRKMRSGPRLSLAQGAFARIGSRESIAATEGEPNQLVK